MKRLMATLISILTTIKVKSINYYNENIKNMNKIKLVKVLAIGGFIVFLLLGLQSYRELRYQLDQAQRETEALKLERNSITAANLKNEEELKKDYKALLSANKILDAEVKRLDKLVKSKPIGIIQGTSEAPTVNVTPTSLPGPCLVAQGEKLKVNLQLVLKQTEKNNVVALGTTSIIRSTDGVVIVPPTLIPQQSLKLNLNTTILNQENKPYLYALGIGVGINTQGHKEIDLYGIRHLFKLPYLHNPVELIVVPRVDDHGIFAGSIGLLMYFRQ